MVAFGLLNLILMPCMVCGVFIRIFVPTKINLILSRLSLKPMMTTQDGFIFCCTFLCCGLASAVLVGLRYTSAGGAA